MPSADPRKDVLLSSCAAFFGIPVSDGSITQLQSARELNTFLDDGNCSVLAATLSSHGGDKKVKMANKVSATNLLHSCTICTVVECSK